MSSRGPPLGRGGGQYVGWVKSYNRKGFGFILCATLESDLYFSRESLHPHLQTSDLAGEQVTFEVRRFPDGKLQAHNLRALGDVSDFKGATAKGGGRSSAGSAPKGGRDDEDKSRDWYCGACGERNFLKRFECFKCKSKRRGEEAFATTSVGLPPRRRLSPHAGSRAMRDMLAARLQRRRSRSRSCSKRKGKKHQRKSESSSSSSSSGSSRTKRSRSRRSSSGGRSARRARSGSGDEAAAAADVGAGPGGGSVVAPVQKTSPEIEQAKADVLDKLLKLKELEKEQRMVEWRSLLRQWHPDKNPDNAEVATAVFQFLQKGKLLLDSAK